MCECEEGERNEKRSDAASTTEIGERTKERIFAGVYIIFKCKRNKRATTGIGKTSVCSRV